MSEAPDKIDELLSGGRLGRPAQERVLARVLMADAPERTARRKRVWAICFGAGTCAVIAAALLLSMGCSIPHSDTYLAAKGGAPRVFGCIEPVCTNGTATCRVGERLFFRVDPSGSRRWLAISAERADETPPRRIWMFPASDGVAPEIEPASEAAVLPRAVELAADLQPGLYRLTILVFNHPPTRDEAASGASASQRFFRPLELR